MYCLICRKKTKYIKELDHFSDLHYCESCDIEYPVSKKIHSDLECPHCQHSYYKKLKDFEYLNLLCQYCQQIYHVENIKGGYYISKEVF